MRDSITTAVNDIRRQGYAIVRDAAGPAMLAEMTRAVERLEWAYPVAGGDPRLDRMRGLSTKRVRDLISRDPIFRDAILFPDVLAVCEALLGPEFLLHATQVIDIGPDERAQPLHTDDMHMDLARPHKPVIVNAIWALTDFTEENGATRIVPGSHLTPEPPSKNFLEASLNPSTAPTIAAEMPKGSILLFDGALWHGGGANRTGAGRVGVSLAYCVGWMRQQENFQLSVQPALARRLDPRLQELCGFGVYQGQIGVIDGKRPADVLLV
ncbi:MAG: phytanoyl-CoA dioxygenase family protein [Hyphomonadaceae bacterium]